MTKPVFLLGVGCQKGGTTWLHHYLSGHESVQLSSPKELNIFETMLRPDLFLRFYFRCLAEDRDWIKKLRRMRKNNPAFATPRQQIEMMNDPSIYVEYFKQFSDKRVTGDITPTYAVLQADDFSYIRSLLDDHFHVKTIFLMRDPVERTRSALRMKLRADHNQVARHLNMSEEDFFRRQFDKTMYVELSLYNNTIAALEAAFPKEDIFYGFFETMFNDGFLADLCDFLTIPFKPGDFGRVVNETAKSGHFDPDLIAQARALYDPAYAFCAKRFGEEFIAGIWPHYWMAPSG
jgi:hypothetical protein